MRFQERLQVTLQERYRRLAVSNYGTFHSNVRYFLDWANQQPAVGSLLAAIERAEPDLDADEWIGALGMQGHPNWPDTEVGRAKVVLRMLRRIVDGTAPRHVEWMVTGESNFNDAIREFNRDAVEPLVEYLQERLGAESDVLYLLERYRRQVLWFDQQALWDRYQADTANGEALYDEHLRRFLFEQGIDYPFAQPESPSGKADVVTLVDGDEPLPYEIKLFGGASQYGVPYIAKGFHQALRYAEDYGKTDAYLVVFNLDDRPLDLPTDDPDAGWPPRLTVAGVTVFLVVVQAAPRPKASKSGKTRPVKVTRTQLVDVGDDS